MEVICQTARADRDAIIMELLTLLARRYEIVAVEAAHRAILTRENTMASVIGPGIAMPHIRLDALRQVAVGVGTSKEGFIYPPDGQRIHLLVLLLAPRREPNRYLQALSSLVRICQPPETAAQVAALGGAEAVRDFFGKGS